MDAFKVRLINEQFELQEKISKLTPFIESEAFKNLNEDQQLLLTKQLVAMNEYNSILIERLRLFGIN